MRSIGVKTKNAAKLWVPVLALTVALHSPALLADAAQGTASPNGAPTAAPASSGGDDLHSVCDSVLNHPQAAATTAPGATASPEAQAHQQKLQYCQAAKSDDDAADANSAMWKVWAAVGVICTYACVASFVGGPTSQWLCVGATVGGSVTDAIVTKNFTSALMGLGTAGAGIAMNAGMSSSKEAAKDGAEGAKKTTEKDIGACISAAMAIMQTFTKYQAMKSSEADEATNLASAKAVQAAANPNADAGANSFQTLQNSGVGAVGSGAGNGSTVSESSAPPNTTGYGTTSGSCAGQHSSSSVSGAAVLQCASASDKTLPNFVSSPKFPEEFQRDTGKSLASFLSGNGPPGPMMAGASGNGLSPGQSTQVAAAIEGVHDYVGSGNEGSGTYAGGGGGEGGGGAAEDPNAQLGAMMSGLMDQMNPNKKKDQPGSGVSAVIFANQTRGPAAVVEDRKLSIFDRVSYRYYYVGRRIVLGEGEK